VKAKTISHTPGALRRLFPERALRPNKQAQELDLAGLVEDGCADEARYRPVSWKLARRLLIRLTPHRRNYFIVCAAGLAVASLEVIPPKLVGQAVDALSKNQLDGLGILRIGGAWIGIICLMQLLHGCQIGLANTAGERVLSRLRDDVFAQLQRLSINYFDKTHPGKIIARAGSDVDTMRNVVCWGLNTLIANAAIMLIAGTMLILADVRLFLSVIWLAPAMLGLSYLYASRVGRAWQSVLTHSTRVGSNQTENIAGMRIVTAFNRQDLNLQAYNRLQDVNTANNVNASQLSGIFQASLQASRFLGQIVILGFGGWRVATGGLAAGTLVAASLYWELLMQPAVNYGAFLNEIMIAMAGAERVFALLDRQPTVQDRPGATALPRIEGHVSFEHVTFAYHAGQPVLKGIDFDVPRGSTVALVGATGCGKTTILSLLSRFHEPVSGRILVDGYDLNHVTGVSLGRQMAMVLQNNYLFSGTVMDNLRYARPEASDDIVIQAAKALGCHEHFLRFKEGYQTHVGERGGSLSLGERQLICFTRALVADPAILLLDEATSAVDPKTETDLQKALAILTKGRTTFIVAHRLVTIFKADLILVMDDGRIIEQGDHTQLMNSGGRYAELVRHYRDAPLAAFSAMM